MQTTKFQRLGASRIACHDFARCADFYAKTLGLLAIERDNERGYATFQLGGVRFVLERVSRDESESVKPSVPSWTGIVFETDHIEHTRTELAASGVVFLDAVQSAPNGALTTHFHDPDGNVLTLRQPRPTQRLPDQPAAFETISRGGRGGIGGPFVAWSQHPCMPQRMDSLGAYFLLEGLLPARLRELAIIVTARIWTAQIEWYAHVPAARRAGISPDVVEAIANRRPPNFSEPDEAIVYACALEVSEQRGLSDATYAAVVSQLGVERTLELVALLGFYATTAMALNVYRLRPPDGATRLLPP